MNDTQPEEACCWEPLEGTPDVFNVVAQQLGLDTHNQWHFVDVLGLDDEIVSLTIPKSSITGHYSAVALIVLYPTTDPEIDAYLKRDESVTNNDTCCCCFLKQLIGGMCGTMAVVHAIANSLPCHDAIAAESPLSILLLNDTTTTKGILPRSRRFAESEAVRRAHQAAVDSGNHHNRHAPSCRGQRQGRHFLTFVHRNDWLWEIDGRREAPTCRGTTSEETFWNEAVAQVRGILAATNDPCLHARCSLVALVPQNVK